MKTIYKTHHYVVKDIKHDAVVAQAFAENEKQVRSMAIEQKFDFEGCEIEMVKENAKDMRGNYIEPKFELE